MQTTSKEQKKTINIIRNLFLFVVLIGFVASNPEKTSKHSNSNRNLKKKTDLVDLNNIDKPKFFFSVKFTKTNDKIESLENFKDTLTFKYIEKICALLRDSNYENVQIKRINIILDILINNISEISEIEINNMFFLEAIFNLMII